MTDPTRLLVLVVYTAVGVGWVVGGWWVLTRLLGVPGPPTTPEDRMDSPSE